ncbi:MAG: carbamoyl-phosphate synthase large subunit [Chloroflexi bacterium]|nr:carbamoyl-phosphate synthase large subunit [Chloroflexota bacterium]
MVKRLLVANRGEIAIRIMRATAELGIPSVAIYSEDDASSLHIRRADDAYPLRGTGVAAYLDIDQIVAAAKERGCDAIHPGYGFLSENAEFARRCEAEGITFIGPTAETLAALGDKAAARDLAAACGVPVLAGTPAGLTPDDARDFLALLGPGGSIVIKAVAGGGGRGMRIVNDADEIDEAFTRCRSEALAAFGNGDLYAEQRMVRARHIEVQIVGDGSGAVTHLYERECSLQRRHQKIVEVAPAPNLPDGLRDRLTSDAVRMAARLRYRSLGTFEFLVDAGADGTDATYAFIEANARLQVEHTVTEEVLDLDLVRVQLLLASGRSLAEVGLGQDDVPAPRGYAVQARVNMETIDATGAIRPSGGTLIAFEPPSGRGIRVDTFGYPGYRPSPNFDSLLAKVICHSPTADLADVVAKTYRALSEFKVEDVRTNIPFLQNLLKHPDFTSGRAHTRFIDDHLPELVPSDGVAHRRLFFEPAAARPRAGVTVDAVDPLAVLAYGRAGGARTEQMQPAQPDLSAWTYDATGMDGALAVHAPMQATIVSVDVAEGDHVRRGQQLLVLNAMKMEHVIESPADGVVLRLTIAAGDVIPEGIPLLFMEEQAAAGEAAGEAAQVDLDYLRPDLAEVERRRAVTLDAARPDSVAARHARGHRTARENVEDLCDPGSFVEYGQMAIATGLTGTLEERLQYAPADGLIMGFAHVNGDKFDPSRSRCLVVSYDYMILAGTQGGMNHRKKDRIFQVAERLRLPVVFFAEGGGGRAGGGRRNSPTYRGGDVTTGGTMGELSGGGGLATPSFALLGKLSGLAPTVGITNGRCFAGNAALLGVCDVVIATKDSNIGMGGPAMVEGGGLGVYRPEDIGPMSVQVANGVVDIAVEDEAEAVAAAKQYLSYFQGPVSSWECADQRRMRTIIPENRLRVYNVRDVIETLADTGSVLELRRGFGLAMITSLIRIEGRPVGVVANNPLHLSGAIDSPAADKAARFMQLCDAYDIPLLFLCDTPGIMVGPEVEKTALVRHAARMFVVGSSVTVPTFTIILRKSYGLGAQTMGGGNHKMPVFTVSWPTGEFGGMGLEGQVKLGRRRELEAIEGPNERRELFEHLVAQAYERGKALNAAHVFEVDDVIDPADSRRWLLAGLLASPPPEPRTGKKRPCIDTW